jgi:hypothetical protein
MVCGLNFRRSGSVSLAAEAQLLRLSDWTRPLRLCPLDRSPPLINARGSALHRLDSTQSGIRAPPSSFFRARSRLPNNQLRVKAIVGSHLAL